MRILHVVGSMYAGGIETWLFQVLRRLSKSEYHNDIMTHTAEFLCKHYVNEMEKLGCRLLYCSSPRQPWVYAKNFLKIIMKNGPYDLIHSHLYYFNGFIIKLAANAGIPVRMSHSHTAGEKAKMTVWRRAYINLMKFWIYKYSTNFLAVSKDAAVSLYGPEILNDYRLKIIPPAVDFTPFQFPVSKVTVRLSLGIPEEAKVVGHVGRFDDAKNHFFCLEVANLLARRNPNIWFIFVGDGPLRPSVEAKGKELGINNRIVFAGLRRNIHEIMIGGMDLLLFPSKREGFGRVVLEAQAAGLPCLISDIIPSDVDVVKPLVHRFSLNESPEIWAEAAWELLQGPPPVSRLEALRLVADSPYNIENNVQLLKKLYVSALNIFTK